MNYGAGDILDIAPADGRDTVLIPFAKAVAREIDFDAGRIVIERPREVEAEEQG
jgi:16S rRNA processing protein RimM